MGYPVKYCRVVWWCKGLLALNLARREGGELILRPGEGENISCHTYGFSRGWRLSASWGNNWGPHWNPLMSSKPSVVLKGLRGALIRPPVCRKTIACWTADVIFPSLILRLLVFWWAQIKKFKSVFGTCRIKQNLEHNYTFFRLIWHHTDFRLVPN